MKAAARIAGLLYLIVVVSGLFSLAYVPSRISVPGDTAATVSNIMASEQLFRLGFVAASICYTAFLLLPLALYRVLSPVGKCAATLMVAFAMVSVPISFVNELNRLDILSLLSRPDYMQAFTTDQLNARVRLSLDAYGNGLLVSKIFWGLWLLPFGYLVYKSGFLPRILGILLMAGCFGYLIQFFGSALFDGYEGSAIEDFIWIPAFLGEVGTCLWLLILGVREPTRAVASGA
jgi:hypothetical protein